MNALFLPYATTTFWQNHYAWQKNLGSYLNRLSGLFSQVRIVAHVVSEVDNTYITADGPIYSYEFDADNITIDPFKVNAAQGHWYARLRKLNDAVAQADFCYIFLPSYKGLFAAFLCQRYHKPYALYIGADWLQVAPFLLPKSVPSQWRPLLTWVFGHLEAFSVKQARFTLAHGKSIIERLGGKQQRIFETIPVLNWTLDEFYDRSDSCANQQCRCLFVGTIAPRKGIKFLLEGVALARQNGIPATLTIVGPSTPEDLQTVTEYIHQFALDGMVTITGYVSDTTAMLAIYREADLFILPTLGEGFPRVIYEAMSQSVPVITTRVGSIPQALTDQENALLVEPASGDAVASAIQALYEAAPLRQRLIKRGMELAIAKFQGNHVQQFSELIAAHLS